jgi:hypothetical protein
MLDDKESHNIVKEQCKPNNEKEGVNPCVPLKTFIQVKHFQT